MQHVRVIGEETGTETMCFTFGDIVTEYNVRAVDVANRRLRSEPLGSMFQSP
jgi:hypothetical protein